MYYGWGNYEAFARPRKPAGVDEKSAYLVGGGLAPLAAGRKPGPDSPPATSQSMLPRSSPFRGPRSGSALMNWS